MDITAAISARIPEALLPESQVVSDFITKWKLFLAPLVDPELTDAQAALDASWSTLQAELIISLVIFDIISLANSTFLISAGSSSGGTGGTIGLVKRVVTGPTEAEYFSPKETMADVMKEGGLFSITRETICTLAARLSIPLYLCPNSPDLRDSHIKPPKVYRTRHSTPRRKRI